MNRLGLFFLLLLVPIVSRSQTLTILDAESGTPLSLVTVFSERPWISSSTNPQGKTELSKFKLAKEIHIQLIGYTPIKTTFEKLLEQKFLVLLTPNTLSLDEVVVSASRWEQSSAEVASLIKTISSKEVLFQNPQTAADLLSISGAVFVQKSQQGGGSPMIRGFATNRLIYSVDGERMNTAIFRAGNIQNVINLDPMSIEQTEILFGPASVLYGSDAIGGVMSFRTITPQTSLDDQTLVQGKASGRYSSANQEKMAHFQVLAGEKKWAFATSFTSWDFGDLKQGSNGPDDYLKSEYIQRINGIDQVISQNNALLQIPTAYSQINFLQKVKFKPVIYWDFDYALHYSETSPYGRYDRHNRYRNGKPRYAEWNYGPQGWLMHQFSLTHTHETLFYDQFTARLAYQLFEESRIDRSLNSTERNTQKENVDAYSINLDFTRQINSNNRIFYGLESIWNKVHSIGVLEDIITNEKTDAASRYPESDWYSNALYINHEYDFSSNFIIQSGVRFNQFKLDADFTSNLPYYPLPFTKTNLARNSIIGSLGSVWKPSKTFSIRVGLGTAFRAPNVDDIGKFFDSEPGSVVVPNSNLSAEYAWNADIGLTKLIQNKIKLELAAYYTYLDNALVRRDFSLNGQDSILYFGEMSQVQAIQNAAFAKIYGVQTGITVAFTNWLSFSTDLNYQHGEEQLDDGTTSPSRHAAPFFGMGKLTYRKKDVQIQFNIQFQGERKHDDLAEEEKAKTEIYAKDSDGNTYSPGWYTLNLKVSQKLNAHFSISAGIENMTDQRYRPYSSGLSAPGRNFIISVNTTL